MFFKCHLIVSGASFNERPTSLFDMPQATQLSTSSSRALRIAADNATDAADMDDAAGEP